MNDPNDFSKLLPDINGKKDCFGQFVIQGMAIHNLNDRLKALELLFQQMIVVNNIIFERKKLESVKDAQFNEIRHQIMLLIETSVQAIYDKRMPSIHSLLVSNGDMQRMDELWNKLQVKD